jgi:hypothetical protein
MSWKPVQRSRNVPYARKDITKGMVVFCNEARALKKDMYFFINAVVISTSDWRHMALETLVTGYQDQERYYI